MAEYWLQEALAWAKSETGAPAQIEVAWVRPGVLGYRVAIDDSAVSLSKRVDL